MKKFILLMTLLLIPLNVKASIIVMDQDNNRVLYGVNQDEVKLIASTTKIMTTMVVLNNTDITKTIEVDECILKSHGSNIYIELGEKITVEDLLYGLMLRSGNELALLK